MPLAKHNYLAGYLGILLPFALLVSLPLPAGSQLAPTPPMGWNSWNHYGSKVTDSDIRAAADAMTSNGMREAGYLFVDIDDGWQGTRDKAGELHANSNFPNMEALSAYVHSKGLLFGIYTSPGPTSCGHFEGSQGHEVQDAALFARWKVDLIKYDVCSFRDVLKAQAGNDPERTRTMLQEVYEKMHAAILATGRPMVLSMSQHGMGEVWKWGAQVGAQLWRTGDDVHPNYESVTGIGFSQAGLSAYASIGHWNDPDMLEIGNGKLSVDEERTQMSLWAILAAPLIAGNDLTSMSPECRQILTNQEVIAVDQDHAGRQGDRVWAEGPIEVWSRVLSDGSHVVGVFNRNQATTEVKLDLKRLGLSDVARARDLWAHKDLLPINRSRSFVIPSHGVLLLNLATP